MNSEHKIEQLNVKLLRTFDALMKEKSVSKAALKLNITQPVVSARLKTLREIFSNKLFIQKPHGIEPTSKALEVIDDVQLILSKLNMLVTTDTFAPANLDRKISVTLPISLQAIAIPKLVYELETQAPMAKIQFENLIPGDVKEKLDSRETDLVVAMPWALSDTLRSKLLFEERYVGLCRNGHPRIDTECRLEQYVNEKHLIISTQHNCFKGEADKVLNSLGLSRNVFLTVANYQSAVATIRQTDLIGIVPKTVVDLNDKSCNVFELPFDLAKVKYYMVWHERYQQDEWHMWFRSLFAATLQTIPNFNQQA